MLYTIKEITFNGYNEISFITLTSIFLGILVIIIKNPIASVLNLIGLFATIALYLILSGLKFLGKTIFGKMGILVVFMLVVLMLVVLISVV